MKIRETRRRLGLTAEEFAKRIGVHAVTLRRWECGMNTPSPLAVRMIAAIVGARRPARVHRKSR